MEMNPVVAHPLIGPMRTVGVPIHFEKTPGAVQRPAPLLGEHGPVFLCWPHDVVRVQEKLGEAYGEEGCS